MVFSRQRIRRITMKKQKIKYLLAVICMLAAGICYSMSTGVLTAPALSGGRGYSHGYADAGGEENQVDLDGQFLTIDLQDRQAVEGTGGQSGLISAETEAGKPTEESGGTSLQESLPRQTESVRFYVHICGEVNSPGVYEVEPGSRIFQVVDMAGGLTEEAAGDCLNMALETVDGMKITVPSRKDAAGREDGAREDGRGGTFYERTWIETPGTAGQEPAARQDAPRKINLNTAGREELMTLRGIGEAKAEAIIRYREEQGPFRTIEEIMNISGIKEAAFEKIKDDITV